MSSAASAGLPGSAPAGTSSLLVLYPCNDRHLRSWTVTPSRSGEKGLELAVAPGVIVGYERNVAANAVLRKHGIEVVSVPGGELGRGRGGPRCMTCPIERGPA